MEVWASRGATNCGVVLKCAGCHARTIMIGNVVTVMPIAAVQIGRRIARCHQPREYLKVTHHKVVECVFPALRVDPLTDQ